MDKRICTSCSERVSKCVCCCSHHPSNVTPAHAWCPKHRSKCMRTLHEKCICARAYAHMQRCRSFCVTKILRTYLESCTSIVQAVVAARPTVVSTKPVARRLSLKKSVQMHASSWRNRRCGVAQESFDHPCWCRPNPVCLQVSFALGHGAHPRQSSIFAMVFEGFVLYCLKCKNLWWAQLTY